jgi:hypothetical protein
VNCFTIIAAAAAFPEKFPRRRWCPEIFKAPLSYAVALGCSHRRCSSHNQLLLNRPLCEYEVHVRFNRREKTGRQQSHVSLSAPKAAEPSTLPFAQRLTCTIDDACEVTGLGRVDRSWAYRHDNGHFRGFHSATACPKPTKLTTSHPILHMR